MGGPAKPMYPGGQEPGRLPSTIAGATTVGFQLGEHGRLARRQLQRMDEGHDTRWRSSRFEVAAMDVGDARAGAKSARPAERAA